MDIVVSGGSDPGRPIPAPKDRPGYLLQLIAVGVFLVAAGTAYTGWTVHQTREDNRVLNCSFLNLGQDGKELAYNELPDYQQRIADQLDCDVPGR
jgi:hypothetical protein